MLSGHRDPHRPSRHPHLEDAQRGIKDRTGWERSRDEGVSGLAAIYGMVAALPDRGEVRDLILQFLGGLADDLGHAGR